MPRKGIRAVRKRLLLGLVALTVLGMVVIDLAALFVMNVYATDRVDRALVEAQHSLPIINGRAIVVDGLTLEQQLPEGFFVAVVADDGRILTRSKPYSLTGEPITPPSIPDPVPAGWAGEPITVSSSDTRFRVQRFDIGDKATMRLPGYAEPVRFRSAVVAGSLAPGEDAVQQLLVFELIATGAAVIAVSMFGALVLNRSLKEQRAAETRLLSFVAAATHELRTPLTTVRGWAELHRVSGKPELAGLALSRIEQEANRMNDLVDQLLELSSLDLNRALRREQVDLRGIAAEVVADMSVLMPDRQITLEAPGEVVVEGDEILLRQVVRNLVSNALKHTGTAVTVTVRRGQLSVADEGPGMAPEVAGQIFDRFYRAEKSESGTGLGLAIVHSVVRAHGGDVAVTTAPDSGTTFTVSLPTVSSSSGT
ncbi:two-component system OmpR family sensor kinase [Kibdelosporangium banguiense]|uniref:Sensor-like histidine kinase SenX3 n=1 Tax=Kibdelosporangium banguiense TaxID=1365924 RepID=A0ABS4TF54_9PSEU|nr:ATP-binding protein [Kibdelosporangium banguiense]MBP2322614.1 two-component system OmpR family sensor kinase [Kibdelosporangium banguiense]